MTVGSRLMSRFDRSSCSFVYKQAFRRASVLHLESASTLLKRAITMISTDRGYFEVILVTSIVTYFSIKCENVRAFIPTLSVAAKLFII